MKDKTLTKSLFIILTLAICLTPSASSLIINEPWPATWNANQTTKLQGLAKGDSLGYSVSGAGDINGDGFDDVIISALDANALLRYDAGTVYVLFGSKNGIENVDLDKLKPPQGIKIIGAIISAQLGNSVSGAGDVNGDGIDDIIIGDSYANPLNRLHAGAAYVIFGSKTALSDLDLKNLSPSQGIKIIGATKNEKAGTSVSGAGDINGDGINDLIVGAPEALAGSRPSAGVSYVIFGTKELSDIDLASFTHAQGFKILGAKTNDEFGSSVSGTGDVNGDGIDDIIIGAPSATPKDRTNAGIAYVIFGSKNEPFDIDLDKLTSAQGAKILGDGLYLGTSVSGAGDVNGDGINDLIIGANGDESHDGAAYVIFGQKTGFSDLDVSSLTNSQGFKISGGPTRALLGDSVSGAGDVNGDGLDDILVGAPNASPLGRSEAGSAYLILGSKSGLSDINVANLSLNQGVEIIGENKGDNLGSPVSGVGDVNGDGVADIIIGAPGDDLVKSNNCTGTAYIVMFKKSEDTLLSWL